MRLKSKIYQKIMKNHPYKIAEFKNDLKNSQHILKCTRDNTVHIQEWSIDVKFGISLIKGKYIMALDQVHRVTSNICHRRGRVFYLQGKKDRSITMRCKYLIRKL